MKKMKIIITAMTMSILASVPAFAAQWRSNANGWWYENDDGGYPSSAWQEIMGKWYYFREDGYMAANAWVGNYYVGADGAMLVDTVTPDGYRVGMDGAYIQDEGVQDTGYLEKYAEVLRGLTPDKDYERRFQLIYVDEDSVPELFISDIYRANGKGEIYLYTYSQGSAKNLWEGYSRNYDFSYAERGNLIHSYYWDNGGKESDVFCTIKGGELAAETNFYKEETWTNYGAGEDYYSVNSKKVSKSVYESQFNAITNGYSFIKVSGDTTHEVTEENIQKMLADMNFAM